jgi:ferredoxin
MPIIHVITRGGESLDVSSPSQVSAMEAIRDHGIDEMMAICGGSLSCATCHVFVAELWLEQLPPIGELEDELLSETGSRRPNSRLACQVSLTEEMDGLTLTIAPE